jgi:hypothetical protein
MDRPSLAENPRRSTLPGPLLPRRRAPNRAGRFLSFSARKRGRASFRPEPHAVSASRLPTNGPFSRWGKSSEIEECGACDELRGVPMRFRFKIEKTLQSAGVVLRCDGKTMSRLRDVDDEDLSMLTHDFQEWKK